MKKIELLAPAGNLESLLAAVHSGADAVYFGYGELNARRNAKNFDEDSLREASRICKERGVKMHMTVNTMVYDREYEQVMRTLEIACRYGIDALIVQDLGVAALVRKAAPEMPMHASTQLTVHNLSGALEAKQLGFSRVVLAREMSRSEIAAIASQAQIETEVFVHGALCMCVRSVLYELGDWGAQRQPRTVRTALPPTVFQRSQGRQRLCPFAQGPQPCPSGAGAGAAGGRFL